jgi:ankyrin repeat protein
VRLITFCVAVSLTFASSAAAADARLIDAITRHDKDAVASLIKARVDVNAAQPDGSTPLFWAVHENDPAIVDLLIRARAKADAADDTGVTPLYIACTNQSALIVQRLLASGANPNAALMSGETPLMNCARTGNAVAVKALITAGAKVDAKESARDQTALMWAAAESHSAAVQVLLEAGADVRARSRVYTQAVAADASQRLSRSYNVERGGSTPLLFAVRVGDVESIRLLIAAGADPNDALADGMSALTLAAYNGQASAAVLLLDKGANPNDTTIGFSALHAAILRADSNKSLSPGLNTLIEQTYRGSATPLDLVKALLRHGADPNARMTKGTPLRRQTADYNLLAPRIGVTPYLLAAELLEVEIMRVLASSGADPALTMPDGSTALMLAAGTGARDNQNRRGVAAGDGGRIESERTALAAVNAALEHNPPINAVNEDGETALCGAAVMGYNQIIELLADKGANVNVKTKSGRTPLTLAIAAGQRRGTTSYDPGDRRSTEALLRRLGAAE